ncbi:TadE-like protein [Nocardioides scoriae]|uniref:TadE-like protein n=1 Tax=Nocardioides scoriae TaxID=642780 RepID=A0A1H1YGK0_9ACTN|nr:TadE/TadG family type IV pilus assembly protein [Nocardioides scoriae]SDT20590.1 TadE-like protein [Nocardioides scoriae]
MVRSRSDDGASAVEFALVMVPLLTLFFGILQYGLYFWTMQGGVDAARRAARTAAVGTTAGCTDFRRQVAGSLGAISSDATKVKVARTYTTQAGSTTVAPGDKVEVTVQLAAYDLNLPFVPFLRGGLISSTASARVDYLPAAPERSCTLAAP